MEHENSSFCCLRLLCWARIADDAGRRGSFCSMRAGKHNWCKKLMNFSLSSQLLCINFAAVKTITFVQFISHRSWYMSRKKASIGESSSSRWPQKSIAIGTRNRRLNRSGDFAVDYRIMFDDDDGAKRRKKDWPFMDSVWGEWDGEIATARIGLINVWRSTNTYPASESPSKTCRKMSFSGVAWRFRDGNGRPQKKGNQQQIINERIA